METAALTFLTEKENLAWHPLRGWLLSEAAEELYKYASSSNPAGRVVEIGSFAGKSTICLAKALLNTQSLAEPLLYAIDIKFQPDFYTNLKRFQVSQTVRFIEKGSLFAAMEWYDPISFLYIDGSHDQPFAYSDILIWDAFILPGGILALDDTAGFMVGPNLQLQAAIKTGAYELLSDVGGVSFLTKVKPIVHPISDFPLAEGSFGAYLDFVTSWIGGMDPLFRLPRYADLPEGNPKKMGARMLDISPRKILNLIFRQFKGKPPESPYNISYNQYQQIPHRLREPYGILKWLEREQNGSENIRNTIIYLNACFDIRTNDLDKAIQQLSTLSELDISIEFRHYKISISQLSTLRLAQCHDLRGDREVAVSTYQLLLKDHVKSEIRQQATAGVSDPFRLTDPSNLLMREYNIELRHYRTYE